MAGVCYGQADVGLAENYQDSFSKIVVDTNYGRVICSPLSRCVQLAQYLDLDFSTDHRLKELNFGDWELKKWDEIDPDEFASWHHDYIHSAPPNGESLIDMQRRVLACLREQQEAFPQGKVLWITHAGVIRIVASTAAKKPLSEMFNIKIGFGEVLKLRMEDCGVQK